MNRLKLGSKTNIQLMILILLILGITVSCTQDPRVIPDRNQLSDNSNTSDNTIPDPSTAAVPEAVNFLQVGTQRYTLVLNLFSDFKDSFLVRGNELNQYLTAQPQPTSMQFCLITEFPTVTGSSSKKVLSMAARVRYYKNFQTQATEYYLQVQPTNESVNNTDCSSAGIQTAINNKYGISSYALTLGQVCPSCSQTISSNSLSLYMVNGQENTSININHLRLSILPEIGSTSSTTATCNSDNECTSKGFNCCSSGQCINHGQVKTGVSTTSNDYLVAINDVLKNPGNIINYSNIFYLCPQYVNSNPDNNQDDPNLDPQAQASELLIELQDLYRCVNPQIDEFGICTKSYDNASTLINGASYLFSAANDDINMSSITATSYNNIYEVEYSGKLLYRETLLADYPYKNWDAADGVFANGTINDNTTSGQGATIMADKPIDGVGDIIRIRYLVNSTCEKISSSLAKCYKIYQQGQSSTPIRSSDHSGQKFLIPSHANMTYNTIVEIEGVKVTKSSTTWSTVNSAGEKGIEFDSSYTIFPGQEIKIQYFVSSGIDTLITSKEEAQSKINAHCACDADKPCNLKPEYNSSNPDKIISYSCFYQQADAPTPPLQKVVYVSAKTMPHKYFDQYGTYFPPGSINSDSVQEGNKFEYTSNSTYKPNNVTNDIGFNEIYGSVGVNETSPMPATVVDVVRGARYDIFTDEGVFASCLDCGTDYYTNLNKLFPNNFLHKGAGYNPDPVESRRIDSQSSYRADDLAFGRACFVPATMIPWTHVANDNIQTQRTNRLAAQHFLFANGLNKDWYGFDYGSIIGSFDGVKWFAIGNQRRIQAKSNKLFLAMNAYFGDLTTGNSFKITISEIANVQDSGSFIDHDTESDGAECQFHHYCENDNDCLTQLGYDYACVNVSAIETPWPTFDSNANEISGSINTRLISIVDGTNGQAKRCVYRGRGAACERNYTSTFNASNSYSKSSDPRFNLCSPNHYCADLSESVFNSRINRYGQSPLAQNNNTQIVTQSGRTDTLGLAARIMGRPYKYYGDDAVAAAVRTQLNQAGVDSICVPGKDVEGSNTISEANDNPLQSADKILGIGKTMSTQDLNYYAFCPAIDADGNYSYMQKGRANLTLSNLNNQYPIGQSISTNALNLPQLDQLGLFNDTSTLVTKIGYHQNTCLRSPGSSCFTDLDCAPNKFIGTRIRSISSFTDVNAYEAQFWKEDLVCARELKRYTTNTFEYNPHYTVKDHTCCRETDKSFTLATQLHMDDTFEMFDPAVLTQPNPNISTDFSYIRVPGVNIPIDDETRYSRVHSLYDLLTTPDADFQQLSPLFGPSKNLYTINDDQALNQAAYGSNFNPLEEFGLKQFLTLQRHNAKMCCTGHWVRNLATGNGGNNGGHKFTAASFQRWDDSLDTFTQLNWSRYLYSDILTSGQGYTPSTNDVFFKCVPSDIYTAHCEIRNIPEGSEADDALMKWFGKFELLGIPQVLIESPRHVYNKFNAVQLYDDDDPGNLTPPGTDPNTTAAEWGTLLPGTFNPLEFSTVNYSNPDILFSESADVILDKSWLINNNVYLDFTNFMPGPQTNNSEVHFISAANIDKFNSDKKAVFSADSFNCCIPTGLQVEDSVTDNMCCTGQVTNQGASGVRRCCLQDYVDLSVYTNLYVSSEALYINGKPISDKEYDPMTGYIKPEIVEKLAATMCCSQQAARGVAIGEYWIPVAPDTNSSTPPGFIAPYSSRRWIGYPGIDSDTNPDIGNQGTQKFRAGMRWNDHVYCVPEGFNGSGSGSGGSGASQQ